MSNSSVVNQRLDFIDNVKALGIILVVLGHIADTPALLVTLIYSFHMPLFFFVSGFLLAPHRVEEPLPLNLQRLARTLLTPYTLFFAISLVFWLLTRNLGDRAIKFANFGLQDALWGFLTGRSVDIFINSPLWFFPTLFVCAAIYFFARRLMSARLACGLSVVMAVLIFNIINPRAEQLPWGLDIAWMALVFYATGHWLRVEKILQPKIAGLSLKECFVIIALCMAWVSLALWQGRVDLALGNFGAQPVLYMACAGTGIGFFVLLARRVPTSAPARWLSDNSLVIFPLHALTLSLAGGLIKLFGPGWKVTGNGLAGSLMLATWAIVTVVPAAVVFQRYAPFLLGRRSGP